MTCMESSIVSEPAALAGEPTATCSAPPLRPLEVPYLAAGSPLARRERR